MLSLQKLNIDQTLNWKKILPWRMSYWLLVSLWYLEKLTGLKEDLSVVNIVSPSGSNIPCNSTPVILYDSIIHTGCIWLAGSWADVLVMEYVSRKNSLQSLCMQGNKPKMINNLVIKIPWNISFKGISMNYNCERSIFIICLFHLTHCPWTELVATPQTITLRAFSL